MLCCVVLCCVVLLCYVVLCYVMLCYVMLCYVMLCYVMLCYVMLCYVMLCYVMFKLYSSVSHWTEFLYDFARPKVLVSWGTSEFGHDAIRCVAHTALGCWRVVRRSCHRSGRTDSAWSEDIDRAVYTGFWKLQERNLESGCLISAKQLWDNIWISSRSISCNTFRLVTTDQSPQLSTVYKLTSLIPASHTVNMNHMQFTARRVPYTK